MATTYATFNPSDKDTFIVLGGGNLNVTVSGNSTWASVRSTIGKSSGKWYWEIKINTEGGSGVFPGAIGNASAVIQAKFLGLDINGWGYHTKEATGKKYNNGTGSAYGSIAVAGDTIGVALDMDAGTITLYINNASQGTMFSGLTGTIYAGVSVIDQGGGGSDVTANFGATAMTYTAPSGYNQGLYTITADPLNITTNFGKKQQAVTRAANY